MAEFGGVNVPEGIASILRQDRDTYLSSQEDMRQEFDQDRMREFPFHLGYGRAMILYNARGEGTVVEGETQILEAIKNGYKYTAETVPDRAPTKDFEEKVYESGFFDSPIENLGKAMEETKMEEKRRKLNFENYDPVVGSTSGYEFRLMPRSYTRPFGLKQIGPMDAVRSYNPESDEYLPKPRPTLAERLMKQGE